VFVAFLIRADFSFSPFSADRKVLTQGGCQVAEMKNREKRENAKNAKNERSKHVKMLQTAKTRKNGGLSPRNIIMQVDLFLSESRGAFG
jgi:hypothetical protein